MQLQTLIKSLLNVFFADFQLELKLLRKTYIFSQMIERKACENQNNLQVILELM